jgi:phage tail sheath gpL-like
MARQTSYFVQSFDAGRGGNLKADAPITCKSATGAVRTAERLASSKAGVVAFSSTGDPEMGDYDDEPVVIFRNGRFPSAFD